MLFRWRTGAFAVAGLALCALIAAADPPRPGVVQILDGHTFTGDITQDNNSVTITSQNSVIHFDKRNVLKITFTVTADDQFNGSLSKLAAADVKGRIDLAAWATNNRRPDLAVTALQQAHKIDATNQDVITALDTAQRQVDLNARNAATPAAPADATATTKPAVAAKTPAMPHRLLTDDEVNIIRQKEMSADDPTIRVRLENNVVARFLTNSDLDAVAFRQLPLPRQAIQILAFNDPKLSNDVRIVTDPQSLIDYKQKVHPLIASSCASNACHGGAKASDFGLFPGNSTPAVYTNFYILQSYTIPISGTQYRTIDRGVPDRSLLLEFSLPENIADVVHPNIAGYRPRFHSRQDESYRAILTWINGLNPVMPRYGVNVSPKLPLPPPAAPTNTRN
jgi:hypothetical protein